MTPTFRETESGNDVSSYSLSFSCKIRSRVLPSRLFLRVISYLIVTLIDSTLILLLITPEIYTASLSRETVARKQNNQGIAERKLEWNYRSNYICGGSRNLCLPPSFALSSASAAFVRNNGWWLLVYGGGIMWRKYCTTLGIGIDTGASL